MDQYELIIQALERQMAEDERHYQQLYAPDGNPWEDYAS